MPIHLLLKYQVLKYFSNGKEHMFDSCIDCRLDFLQSEDHRKKVSLDWEDDWDLKLL